MLNQSKDKSLSNITMNQLKLELKKQLNILNGITCNEAICIDKLKKLLESDLLRNRKWDKNCSTEAKLLGRYKTMYDTIEKLAPITYCRVSGMNFGRANPKANIGLFGMRRALRHTLANSYSVDWDIVNAHPTMLLQICKANGLACDKLEIYVENREDILQRIMTCTGCNEARAKMLFIRLLYFGRFENWLKEKKDEDDNIIEKEIDIYAFQDATDITQYIDDLTTQLAKIGEIIVASNPKLAKEVDKNKEKKGFDQDEYNRTGSIVSFFLQEYEIRILEVIYKYCVKKGYIKNNVCVLCADGIMLLRELIQDADLATEFNAVVLEETGFNLRFKEKVMDEDMTDILDEHKITLEALDQSELDRFNSDYFSSLNGYRQKKIYFEHFVQKILRPDPQYVYTEKANKVYFEDCYYNQQKINETFKHLGSGEFNSLGIEIRFMSKWLEDETIKYYNQIEFAPFNCDTCENPPDPQVYNLFKGFHPYTRLPEDTEISRERWLATFKDLGLHLCGGNPIHFNFFYKYLAHIIQFPQEKNPLAFVIKGKEGCGKNMFLNAFGMLLGKEHYVSSCNPQDFFGTHAEGWFHKLCVNMNECEGKDTFDFEGKMKSSISEATVIMNKKFCSPIEIANYGRLIVFSNKAVPIKLDVRAKDRRWTVFETTDHYLAKEKGAKYWKDLKKHFEKPLFISALYNDLLETDLSTTDWRKERPITVAYRQLAKHFISAEIMFLEHKCIQGEHRDHSLIQLAGCSVPIPQEQKPLYLWSHTGINGLELYKEFMEFCKEYGFFKESSTQKITLQQFYCRLRESNLQSLREKNPQNKTTYEFNHRDLLNEMKTKGMVEKADEDEIVVEEEVEGEEFTF